MSIQKTLNKVMIATLLFVVTFFCTHSFAQDNKVKLHILADMSHVKLLKAFNEEFHKNHPNIEIGVDIRGGGVTRENLLRTLIAADANYDLFIYNSGALLYILNPINNLMNLSSEPFMSRLHPEFIKTITVDDHAFGVPFGTAAIGGILYNKRVYRELDLSVPQNWHEFMNNVAMIQLSGIASPIGLSLETTWTTQMVVLADFHNVIQYDPDFVKKYEEGDINLIDNIGFREGFEKYAEIASPEILGVNNRNKTFEETLAELALGKIAHYPAHTFALGYLQENYAEYFNDIGFFPIPSKMENAKQDGVTLWMPQAIYAFKKTKHPQEVLEFLNFLTGPDACKVINAQKYNFGPAVFMNCIIQDGELGPLKDAIYYYKNTNYVTPALEFLTYLKGPSLEVITSALGKGEISVLNALERYQKDLKRRAVELKSELHH